MDRATKALASFKRIMGEPHSSPAIPTKPVPASRPRVSRGFTYYLKNYRDWRDQAHRLLRETTTGRDPVTGPVAILTEIVGPKPKTTKRFSPRGDNDNFEKSAWDAVTRDGRFWGDDDQIVLNLTHKRYAAPQEQAGIYMHIYELELGDAS